MADALTNDPHHQAHGVAAEKHGLAHPVPLWLLFGVFGILIVLTFATVAVTHFNLGPFNIWVALGIAVLKASLVALYFMHLRWDAPFNSLIFVGSLFILAIFIGVALMDTREYSVNYAPPSQTGAMP